MTAAPGHRRTPRLFDRPEIRVGGVAVAALIVEAVLARVVLDVHLNFFAQLAALWVFAAYKLSGRRDRISEVVASIAVIAVTTAVLLVYGF
jgi:hypothetical protein